MKRNQNMSYDRARNYICELKARFQEQPEIFNSFQEAMRDIMGQKVRPDGISARLTDEALTRLKAILHGHDDLIRGLSFFLPPSHRFVLDGREYEDDVKEAEKVAASETTKPGFEEAKDLIEMVRMRGHNVYEAFKKTLLSINQSRSFDDVCNDVVELFIVDADLLQGFQKFMPIYKPTPLAYYAPSSQRFQ